MDWYPIVNQAFGEMGDEIVLDGNITPRWCRFCERDESLTTFRNRAHVIPAALGNSSVFSRGECDECNHRYGQLESHLVNFMGPMRTISGIRTRSGVPTFRRRPDSPPIRSGGPGVVLMNEEGEDDGLVLHHGEDGKSLDAEVEYPPFEPTKVGQALARMALFYLGTRSGSSFRHLLHWVRGDVSWNPKVYEVLLPGGTTPNGVLMVLAPSLEYSQHTLVVTLVCSHMVYFLPLPDTDWAVPDPPWDSILELFSMFGSGFKLLCMEATGPGRVVGWRRTIAFRSELKVQQR